MRKVLTAFIMFLSACGAGVFAGGPVWQDPVVPGRAIVRVADHGDPQTDLQAFLNAFNQQLPGTTVIDSIPVMHTHLLQLPPASQGSVTAALNASVNQGLLTWGELAYAGQAPEGKSGSTWADDLVVTAVQYIDQYGFGLTNVGQAQTYSIGSGTVVAVLDTGIDAGHPALAGSLAPGGYNFITSSTDTSDVGDGSDNDGDGATDEMTGHGTYVAGLIRLVAPGAKILPITVLNSDGVGDGWLFAKGLNYAIDRGVEVINLSLGSTYNQEAVAEAVLRAKSLGIIVTASAGNLDTDEREFPACLQENVNGHDEPIAFGVAATDKNDVKGGFSSYNKRLFISAPGAGQASASASMISTTPGGGYAMWEGTSASTPLVSGAAALIRSQHPEWPSDVTTWQNIRAAMTATAVDIYPINPDYDNPESLGVGRIDIGAMAALGPPAPGIGDLDGNGVVDIDDLFNVINHWGQTHASADLDGNGVVDVDDLFIVINHWT